jgi:hypothetical protein
MKFTIGYIDHNDDVFNKYLGPSLLNLSGDFDVIKTKSSNSPAINYNEILKKSNNRFVILTHQDISFSKTLLQRIEKTINDNPNFGVLGFVGVDSSKKYFWSDLNKQHEVQTLDCCFIVADKENNVFFDEKTFNDFHLYVEDFCLQTKKSTGKSPYTILISKDPKTENFLCHHSVTLKNLGSRWGKYDEYRKKLLNKWGNVKTT